MDARASADRDLVNVAASEAEIAGASSAGPVAIPLHALSNLVAPTPQTKLTVSEPGDRLEMEADAAADRVMGGPAAASPPSAPDDASNKVTGVGLQRRETSSTAASSSTSAVSKANATSGTNAASSVSSASNTSAAPNANTASSSSAARTANTASSANATSSASTVSSSKATSNGSPTASTNGTSSATSNAHARETAPAAPAPGEAQLAGLRGRGVPLPSELRGFYESRFGRDFADVRVHDDQRAAETARALRARAFTYGADIVFGDGEYAPGTDAGRHLIAHELAHVIQQGAASPSRVMRKASYGTPGNGEAFLQGPTPSVSIEEDENKQEIREETEDEEQTPDVQREALPGDDAGAAPPSTTETVVETGTAAEADAATDTVPAQAPPTPPAAPAVPTLTLTPGATLVRGSSMTATVGFTPTAGEAINVSDWTYATTDHGDVTRPAGEPTFQSSWAGTMAQSGTLTVTYAITPAGGTAGADQTLTQDVAVSDRTGSPWAAVLVENAEAALAGRPAPPVVFSDLGLHNSVTPGLTPTGTNISAGPNSGLRFVSSITTGNFRSNPFIHPNLTAATSRFKTFHSDPSRLYLMRGTAKTLIPLAEYSALSTTPSLTFTVPDWEAFYKLHSFYTITASFNGNTVPVRNAWWRLDSNDMDAGITIHDDAAVRAALAMTDPADSWTSNITGESWSGFELMQAPAILTGTQSHEYVHATHSHRANFKAMIRALDPPKLLEKSVSSASNTVDFAARMTTLMDEIREPNHELVDEAQSAANEEFVAGPGEMAGVNTDPDTGDFLGTIWNITGDDQMAN